MPWVQLFDGDRRTVWAGIVQADWSPHGTGRQVNIRHDDRLRIIGTNEALATWLYDWLIRPEPGSPTSFSFEPGDVDLAIDLESGLRAAANGVEIEITGPLDRQLVRREQYPLGDFRPTCSWVRIPCSGAAVTLDGEPVPGAPDRSTDAYGIKTTAQINVAEVWTT